MTETVKPSVEVAAAQDRAVRAILDDAYARARDLLLARMDLLDAVAGYLYEHERMTGDDFEAIVEGRLRPSSTTDWRSPSASPRPWHEIPGVFAAPVAPAWPGPRRSGPSRKEERRGRREPLPEFVVTRRGSLLDRWFRRALVRLIVRTSREITDREVGGGDPGAPA